MLSFYTQRFSLTPFNHIILPGNNEGDNGELTGNEQSAGATVASTVAV